MDRAHVLCVFSITRCMNYGTCAAKICKILCCVSFYFSPLLACVIFTAARVSVWPRCFNQVLLCCKLIIALPPCLWALWVVFNIAGHHLICLLVSIYRWFYQYFCSLNWRTHKSLLSPDLSNLKGIKVGNVNLFRYIWPVGALGTNLDSLQKEKTIHHCTFTPLLTNLTCLMVKKNYYPLKK